MLVHELLNFTRSHWLLVSTVLICAYLLRNKFQKGLNKYPGPWLASYTDLWRFFDVLGRKPQYTHIRLHRQYGDVVRLGPNVLSFADPKAIKIIYGLNKGFVKSNFYPIQQATSRGKRLESIFSTTNEDFHARYRRCVNNAFAMSALVSYEPLVNSTLEYFLDRTQQLFVTPSRPCLFTQWLQFFAFDVIGELTWSTRLGFLAHNTDVDGVLAFIFRFLSYAGAVGQIPVLDLLLEKNPLKLLAERHGLTKTVFPVTQFALSRSAERGAEMAKIRECGLPHDAAGQKVRGVDLLSKFNAAAHEHPGFMTETLVLTSCVSMVFAGAETTAISLSSVFYHLVKHPAVYAKLMREIDAAVQDGTIESRESGAVSWAEAQKLVYLDAVVLESFRVHPAAGLILERVVPKQGMEICGHFVKGGTIVGCSPWVLHRREEVFGADADDFRPERWIEATPAQSKEMKASMFQFGAGARTCIGKNISLLEIYKLVPSFLRRFEIELEDPTKEWTTNNGWFVRTLDFNVRFKPRATPAVV